MKRTTAAVVISILSCVVLTLGLFSLREAAARRELENSAQISCRHAFAELQESLSGIDTALQKSVYVRGGAMESAVCAEVFGRAMTAQAALSALPFSTWELERTAGFISRVGDFALAMTRAAAQDGLTDEQRESLRGLSGTATLLAQNLSQLRADMSGGAGSTADAERSLYLAEDASLSDALTEGMQLIESEFPETPSLIYDGPFSEHITETEPKMLEGREEITEDEGRRLAAEFLGTTEGRVYPAGSCEGALPALYYSARIQSNEFTVAVSRQGGEVIGFVGSREPAEGDITQEEAVETARAFLERRGFENMRESYYIRQGGVVTVNFAYEQDGVICYSDLIKVGVAADTGGVCSFEARGYLTSHTETRELPEPEISAEEAKAQVSGELSVLSEGLAVIPTDGKYEKLCYEFKCEAGDGSRYIIYVNAVTGRQEKLLILIEDENGTLTI